MNGTERILHAFQADGKAALMPYFTVGYPDMATSLAIIEACCRAGAGLMELGLPFSDPLADGPTIQHSTQVALQAGTTTAACLEAVSRLRRRGVETPILLMGYINPILRFGVEGFVRAAALAGADGFIVPDLPPEEAGEFQALARDQNLSLIHMLAPNSTPVRTRMALQQTTAFLYLVSVTGVTGAREGLPEALGAFIRRVRAASRNATPLAVGFGIGSGAQARAVAELADGVIVGSALIETVRRAIAAGRDPAEAARGLVRELRTAIG